MFHVKFADLAPKELLQQLCIITFFLREVLGFGQLGLHVYMGGRKLLLLLSYYFRKEIIE